jgi:hypothetical protein
VPSNGPPASARSPTASIILTEACWTLGRCTGNGHDRTANIATEVEGTRAMPPLAMLLIYEHRQVIGWENFIRISKLVCITGG